MRRNNSHLCAAITRSCDALGLPRRAEPKTSARHPIEKLSDAVNEEWRERFRAECDDLGHEVLRRYHQLMQKK